MTDVIRTISQTGSPDYSTPQLWEDAVATLYSDDLVTNNVRWIGEIQDAGDNYSGSTTLLTVGGSTVNSSYYKYLRAASGAGFADHANASTNALKYNESNGCSLTSSVGYAAAVAVTENYFRMEGLQVQSTSTTGRPLDIQSADCRLKKCIFEADNSIYVISLSTNAHVSSCLIVQRGASSVALVQINASGVNLYNCALVVPSDVTAATNAIEEYFATGVGKNCAMFGISGAISNGSGMTFTTSHSDSTTSKTGVTTSLTYADQFEATTEAGMDFRCKSGGDLIDSGTYDATNAPDDIIGTAFGSGTTDSGCWELAATSITIDGSPAALTLAGQSSQVDLGATIDGAIATLTLAGQSSQVDLGATISGIPAALSITGLSAQVDQGISLDGIIAALTLAGVTGDVTLGQDILLNGSPAALTLAGVTGDISLGSDISIDGAPATLTLAGQSSQVDLGAAIDGAPATLTLTGAVGDVVITNDIIINASPASLTLNGVTAALTQQILIDGAPATLALTGVVGDVAQSILIDGSPAVLNLQGVGGAVLGNITLDAAPATLTLTGVSGTVTAGAVVTVLHAQSIEIALYDTPIKLK